MIKRYRSKPIEAVQWTGKNLEEVANFCGQDNIFEYIGCMGTSILFIRGLDGLVRANAGDYVIKFQSGDFYVHDPDEFEAEYDEFEAEEENGA
jgi:hypothetical protein